ncbi:hypothetical protein CBR_g52625 [Chara braunii]|uniref:Uncharacterized protein n=1 Tax=Chara braunii TaxID=69332 RepID=A0A388MAV6_CHABU|nr:hypothetical protein CBR_g52625 [Chara braunii]|eukprot:GBG91589.1 hypothetical protein CBR_g52625 [Chara braunii]
MPIKKGCHVVKYKKVFAEGPSKGSGTRDDEWVTDFDGAGDDEDVVSGNEVEAVRQASVHAQGALQINQSRPQTASQPRGGEGVRKADIVIDVDAGHVAREVQVKVAPQTSLVGGSNERTRVTALPEGKDSERIQSPPATPHGQTVPEAGGVANVVVQGSVRGPKRQNLVDTHGSTVAGSSRTVVGAAAVKSHGMAMTTSCWLTGSGRAMHVMGSKLRRSCGWTTL